MAYEISFFVGAALIFFVDLALLSMPKLGDKRKITLGLVATITAFLARALRLNWTGKAPIGCVSCLSASA